MHPILELARTGQPPRAFLESVGVIFATFDERTQDSGNASYGIEVEGAKYFVKTAGKPSRAHLERHERIGLLRNGAGLNQQCPHPAMPKLHNVIESPEGPMLIYDWVEGELLGVPKERREDPRSSFQRFRALPVEEITRALSAVYDLHHHLARAGWIASDFYDGSLIYDFQARCLFVVDLDHYHHGPFKNTMGRMFGSTRLMAPEEHELGASIDQRATVFTMGRTALVFLSDGSSDRASFRGSDDLFEVVLRACAREKEDRWQSFADFWNAWRLAAESDPH
ncbi:MAG TPA: hypothetical protein VG944_01855 [Fimbriimonas sp.]|nr:hypothetical protein [Fimbriimonas sp.]